MYLQMTRKNNEIVKSKSILSRIKKSHFVYCLHVHLYIFQFSLLICQLNGKIFLYYIVIPSCFPNKIVGINWRFVFLFSLIIVINGSFFFLFCLRKLFKVIFLLQYAKVNGRLSFLFLFFSRHG